MHRIQLSILSWIVFTLLFTLTAPYTWGSCGSSNCFLITGTQEGVASPDQVAFDLSYRFIPMDKIQKGDEKASEALVPKIDFKNDEIVENGHSETRTNNELMQIDIGYGVSKRFVLALALPFLNNRTHEHAHVPGSFTREDGTSGFGDIRLNGRYALWLSTKHLMAGGLGVKFPTGEYKLLDHDGEINEPTIMPGTGSWDGLFSFYYDYQIMPHQLDLIRKGIFQLKCI